MTFKRMERALKEFFELDNRYISVIPKPYHDVAIEVALFLKDLLQAKKQPSWLKVYRLLEELRGDQWKLNDILLRGLEHQINNEKKKKREKHEKKDR